QADYAGLDSYVSVLVYRYIIERADPIFFTPVPDAASLAAGTTVRLYTRTNTRCVAEGAVVNFPESTWGHTGLWIGRRRLTDRLVVNLAVIRIPGALALYGDKDGGTARALESTGVQAMVLWDTVSHW
ncbi:unnamed protein product, partial [Laminaria digitata]